MPFLSVIIPVYKVEDYLNRCVESVLNQNFTDLEVILVDDGSPDNCPKICDDLAQRDVRVKVIHKQNGGLSSARNAGIEVAQGEYIAFLDSDDAWAEGKLAEVVDVIKKTNSEMTIFASCDKLANGELYQRKGITDCTDSYMQFPIIEYYKRLIENGNLQESACTKILNAKFLKDNDLTFQYGIISEDTEWMFRVLRVCKNVVATNVLLFVCTYGREGSISNTAGVRSINSLLKIIDQSKEYYVQNENSPIKEYELTHCAYLLSIVIGIYGGINRKDKKVLKPQIKKYKNILKYSNSKKVKLVRICMRLTGFNITAKVLNRYMKENKKRMLNRERIDG